MLEVYHLLIGLLTFVIGAYWSRNIRQRFQGKKKSPIGVQLG